MSAKSSLPVRPFVCLFVCRLSRGRQFYYYYHACKFIIVNVQRNKKNTNGYKGNQSNRLRADKMDSEQQAILIERDKRL